MGVLRNAARFVWLGDFCLEARFFVRVSASNKACSRSLGYFAASARFWRMGMYRVIRRFLMTVDLSDLARFDCPEFFPMLARFHETSDCERTARCAESGDLGPLARLRALVTGCGTLISFGLLLSSARLNRMGV